MTDFVYPSGYPAELEDLRYPPDSDFVVYPVQWNAGEVDALGSHLVLTGTTLDATGFLTSAPVSSVAGRTGAITLTHSDLTDWASATAGFLNTWNAGTVSALGSGVALSGGTLSATGSGGTVTNIASGAGLSGGPITTTGTLTAQWQGGTVTALGADLAISGSTLSVKPSYTASISAAGTNQGTATALASDYNEVGTVASGTGVILRSGSNIPQCVINRGANSLAVYPNSGAQIEALGTNAAATVTVGASVMFCPFSSTQWYVL